METYFAEVINNKVMRVIVADKDFINSGKVGDSKNWTETFMDKDYAGIGRIYDKITKSFIEPIIFKEIIKETISGSEIM